MKQRQIYIVKYSINYPSGKKYQTKENVLALSEYGARCKIEWLHSNRELDIISINSTNKFIGSAIYEDIKTIGDF